LVFLCQVPYVLFENNRIWASIFCLVPQGIFPCGSRAGIPAKNPARGMRNALIGGEKTRKIPTPWLTADSHRVRPCTGRGVLRRATPTNQQRELWQPPLHQPSLSAKPASTSGTCVRGPASSSRTAPRAARPRPCFCGGEDGAFRFHPQWSPRRPLRRAASPSPQHLVPVAPPPPPPTLSASRSPSTRPSRPRRPCRPSPTTP